MVTRPKKVLVVVLVLIGLTVAIGVWRQPALCRVRTLIGLWSQEAPSNLPVPVKEVASRDLVDTWGAPRGDNRRHEGIDIFAPLGQPVTSTTRGIVFKVGQDRLGGNVVIVVGPGWHRHYYAHLDRFADIKPGTIVQKGTVLGYVGNTGNARGTPPHLHYGVYGFLGGATNPYPLLAGNLRREPSSVDPRKQAKKTGQRKVQTTEQRNLRKSGEGKSTPAPRNGANKARAMISRHDVR